MKQIVLTILLCGCTNIYHGDNKIIRSTKDMVGMNEQYDRTALSKFMGVDPVRTEWCAAFVNAVLNMFEIPGSDSINQNPLLARSFLEWGNEVDRSDIKPGDVVIFPRGTESWQGHVGFFYGVAIDDTGEEYWLILGGNQGNSVSIDPFRADSAISTRRWVEPEL
jgi:uncharacterized protein (TIGR02594 family)